MKRFIRDFELVIKPPSGKEIVVRPPQRIVFSCDKSITGGLNKLSLQAFNLNEQNRLAIVKDAEERKRIPILLKVGYVDDIEVIFQGSIHTSSNDRQGPDLISTIEAYDGGEDYFSGYIAATVANKEQAVNAVVGGLDNVNRGKFTQLKEITRPKVLIGNPLKILPSLLQQNETFYIDNEQLFIVKDDEVTEAFIPLVNAKTGLLKTPQREAQKVTFETLMNPSIKLGSRCKLESVNAPYLNGVIKIESMNYSGDSDGNDWSQSVTGISSSNFKVL